ncbi:hypothetical protein LMG28688_04630 [Paraburkholderia caffeinitolerans]|uniref:Uncharacterized protein n=1 Tax=Paraburkholderia caffeinitolerans TaxID=1723730 RepID=A0A6J5GFB9_9BURK|nr:hypothetical protein LMG28688_04630 [Paraburkholderia caffeinitolerans]
MRVQRAKRAFIDKEFERNVIGVQTVCAVRDERAERMLRDERVQDIGAGLVEMGWDVNGGATGG